MRDPARIHPLLEKIEQVWLEMPDLRLCQLILDIVGMDDPYYLEDVEFDKYLDNWIERRFV